MKSIHTRQHYFDALRAESGSKLDLKDALETALNERARELEFYWKRTTYAWTLNAAVFAGYFALGKEAAPDYNTLGIVASLGFVCAVAWWCLNRGSKYWQENWEIQVNLLEPEFHGPLHRINPDAAKYRLWRIHRAYPFSVTKINQHLSLFIALVWLALAVNAGSHLDWSLRTGSPLLAIVFALSVVACLSFWLIGASTPHHSVLGQTVWLTYHPIDTADCAGSSAKQGVTQAV